MKTIKIILLLFCIILGINAKAQTVGYTYKALAAEGCNMKYSVAKQDTIYSIVATVRSDRMNFLTKPTMKIRTFTGKYLELRGTVIGNGSQSAGVISGNIVIPITNKSKLLLFDFSLRGFKSAPSSTDYYNPQKNKGSRSCWICRNPLFLRFFRYFVHSLCIK